MHRISSLIVLLTLSGCLGYTEGEMQLERDRTESLKQKIIQLGHSSADLQARLNVMEVENAQLRNKTCTE